MDKLTKYVYQMRAFRNDMVVVRQCTKKATPQEVYNHDPLGDVFYYGELYNVLISDISYEKTQKGYDRLIDEAQDLAQAKQITLDILDKIIRQAQQDARTKSDFSSHLKKIYQDDGFVDHDDD